VVSVELNGTEECDCEEDTKDSRVTDSDEDCISEYPCVTVMVNYSIKNEVGKLYSGPCCLINLILISLSII